MVAHGCNASSTDIAVDAYGVQKWRGKIGGTVGIYAIAAHAT